MEKAEYIKQARALGHTDEMIELTLKAAEEAEKEGFPYELESQLIPLPDVDSIPEI